METPPLYDNATKKSLSLWVKLLRCHSTMLKISSESIRSFGLTEPQFAVIETLGHLGPLSLSALSKKQLVTGANMTVVVDNLQKQGYVKRRRTEADRRTIFVELTTKGKRIFISTFPKHAQVIHEAMSKLSEKEIEQLSGLLKKLGTGTESEE